MNLHQIKNPSGILLLNKPEGITSFKALGSVKRNFSTKKVGHAGTLDQFASGLMIVGIGDGTKLMSNFVGMDKVYEADILFGVETSTLDPNGEIVGQGPIPSESELIEITKNFIGLIKQVPPKYSAIHIDGKRAYERVLSGEEFEMPSREVTVHSIELHEMNREHSRMRIHCSSGTYIRSLARDIAYALGTCAHVFQLNRTSIGSFSLDEISENKNLDSKLIKGMDLVSRAGGSFLLLKEQYLSSFINGRQISSDFFNNGLEIIQGESVRKKVFVVFSDQIVGLVEFEGTQSPRYIHVFPQGI